MPYRILKQSKGASQPALVINPEAPLRTAREAAAWMEAHTIGKARDARAFLSSQGSYTASNRNGDFFRAEKYK